MELVVRRVGVVTGRLQLADGTVPKQAYVSIGENPLCATLFADSISVFNGELTLVGLPPGIYELKVYGTGFESLLIEGGVVEAGKSTELGSVVLDPGRTVRGRVVSPGGRPARR